MQREPQSGRWFSQEGAPCKDDEISLHLDAGMPLVFPLAALWLLGGVILFRALALGLMTALASRPFLRLNED